MNFLLNWGVRHLSLRIMDARLQFSIYHELAKQGQYKGNNNTYLGLSNFAWFLFKTLCLGM